MESGYKATERRLRQQRERRLSSYLMYVSIAIIAVIVVFIAFILNSSFLKEKAPQSPAERQYMLSKELLKKDPNNVNLLMQIAQAEMELGKAGDSINHMKTAIKIQRYAPMLHFTLAQGYQLSGNTGEAIKAFEQELKVTQDQNELAAFELGRIYYDQKKYDKALEYFQLALKRMAANSDLHYYLGMTYEAKKDTQSAISEYKEVLQFVPDHREAAEALLRLTSTSVDQAPTTAPGTDASKQTTPGATSEDGSAQKQTQ